MADSVLVELGRLSRSVPRPGAPVIEIAAWYERKAALLERAAGEDRDGSAAVLTIEAGRARRRAARLVREAA